MDWKKSKNILIFALILTNLVLFGMTGGFESLRLEDDDRDPMLEAVISLLERRGVTIGTPIPEHTLSIKALDLEYHEVDGAATAQKLLTDSHKAQEGLYIGRDGALLVIALEREMRFELPMEQWLMAEPLETEAAWQAGEAFLEANGFDDEDRRPWSLSAEPDHVILEWRQSYGEYFLEEAFMRVRLTGDQVVSFERRWFNDPIPQENEHRVIPPSKALFIAAEEMAQSSVPGTTADDPVRIEGIHLGYKLETGALTSGITSGEASPYWRLRLSDGRVIFVEAVE